MKFNSPSMIVTHYAEDYTKTSIMHRSRSFSRKEFMKKQQRWSSGLMSFEIDGSEAHARQVVNSLTVFKIGVS